MKIVPAILAVALFPIAGIAADSRSEADLMTRMGFSPAEVDAGEQSRAHFKAQLSTVPAIPKADRDAALERARQMEADSRRDEASRDEGKIIAVPMPGPLGIPTDEEAAQEATVNARGQQRQMSDSDKLERQNEARSIQFEETFKSPEVKRQEAAEKRAGEQAAAEAWCAAHPVECAARAEAAKAEALVEKEMAKQEADDLKSKYERAISEAETYHRPVDTRGLTTFSTSSEARDVQSQYQLKVVQADIDADAKKHADEDAKEAQEAEDAKKRADADDAENAARLHWHPQP
jgi:hypothetical protein